MTGTPSVVAAEALAWLGTPYHQHAWLKGVGCDCAGLVIGVGRAAGVLGFDPDGPEFRPWVRWGRQPAAHFPFQALDRWLVRVRPASVAQPGDVLLFRVGLEPQHVAILMPGDELIHAEGPRPPRGVVRTSLADGWRERLAGAWQYAGLTD